MYKFPQDLYTDVRIETTETTDIFYENKKLNQNKTKVERGALIRIFDGERWYYSSTTDIDNIQNEIDELSKIAKPKKNIYDNPVVKRLEINNYEELKYKDKIIFDINNNKKIDLIESYLVVFDEFEEVSDYKIIYKDTYQVKEIVSSKGTNIKFDVQNAYLAIRYNALVNKTPQMGAATIYEVEFDKLFNRQDYLRSEIKKDIEFAAKAVPVKPGKYTCILSPITAGVFAHESFGHKSEADFMIGDESMMKEWKIGCKVGAPILNIMDSGNFEGSGYVPFDDEGTKAKENYLVKNGVLAGRLHSS
ncbi:MAG: TldD/PmbA family protein, partial [Clostridiaceae bacterium]|nr:TldD/PmbA family protein [Clostridiaceae bacterium]